MVLVLTAGIAPASPRLQRGANLSQLRQVSSSAFQYKYDSQLSGVFLNPIDTRKIGDATGRRGARRSTIDASLGVRAPLRRLHERHAVTMLSHVFSPPNAEGTT